MVITDSGRRPQEWLGRAVGFGGSDGGGGGGGCRTRQAVVRFVMVRRFDVWIEWCLGVLGKG